MPKYRFTEIAFNSTEKKKPTEADKYTYIGLEHLDSGTLTVSRWGADVAPIGEKLIMKKGDVLFGKRRAYQKKVGIAPFDGIFSAHGMVLRPREEVITKEYFPLFISSDYFLDEAIRISVGSLSPTVNWKDLGNLVFSIPTIEDQKRITPLVWAAIDAKNAYKKQLAATDELVKSQFIEQIDGHYPEVLLGDEIETTSGGTPSRKKPEYYEEGTIPWMSSGEVNQGIIDHVEGFITEAGFKNSSAKWIPAESVVIAMYGATVGAVGLLKIPTTTNQAVCSLLPNKDFDPLYLYQAVKQKHDWMVESTMGAAQPNISQTIIKKMPLPKPPIDTQREFAAFIRQSDKSKFELQESIKRIDRLIRSLMQYEQ